MPNLLSSPPFVSTFLSHSSADSELVEAVAERLGRRGVLAWLDKNELLEMGPLDEMLKQAVQQQATLTIFLSEASLNSEWCKDELRWSIEAGEGYKHLLPVYLGDPLKLVKRHPLLRGRFLHADGDRVNHLGYACLQDETNPDPDEIAQKIAATAYQRTIPKSWSEIVIVLDQRGNGPRRGFPSIPDNVARLNSPTLTFRPSTSSRQIRELLTGDDWADMAKTLEHSLSNALATLRGEPRKVRVLGNAQTGLVWIIGQHFDRTTSADLYGYDRDGLAVSNQGQIRHTSLSGGDSNKAKLIAQETDNLSIDQPIVALGIGANRYAPAVQQAAQGVPLFWIESEYIDDSSQAMQLVADIVASVERIRHDHNVQGLMLFWTTANHVALLVAANLTSHVIPKIQFMEWDHARAEYIHLPMPSELPLF